MTEGQALAEAQRELRDMEDRAERAEHELNEWERGDVGQANRLMADRCINAEHVARNATARAEKAEAALANYETWPCEGMGTAPRVCTATLGKIEACDGDSDHAPGDGHGIFVCGECWADAMKILDEERAKVATARAVMAEEAAQKVDPPGYDTPIENRHVYERLAKSIRALAQLPAGLVVLPVEVVANARVELLEAHGRAERCECDKPCSTCATIAALDAAGGAT